MEKVRKTRCFPMKSGKLKIGNSNRAWVSECIETALDLLHDREVLTQSHLEEIETELNDALAEIMIELQRTEKTT